MTLRVILTAHLPLQAYLMREARLTPVFIVSFGLLLKSFCSSMPSTRATISPAVSWFENFISYRKAYFMAEYIEGKRPVLEALKVGVPVKRLYVADGLKGDKTIDEIVRRAHKTKISVKQVKRHELDERSERGSHQGIMLEAGSYQYSNVNEIVIAANKHADANDGKALIVVLDHITDAGNLGAIARSAEVVGASGIIIPSKRSARVTAATYKSSAGAVSHIKIAQVSNIAQTIENLKKENFWVAGASEKAQQCIWDSPLAGRLVLVMGNEGEGLARLTQERCDFLVALPQAGEVGSLNVAQASTACMYEWMRQCRG